MGFGAGHILDMVNRMKQNRVQRPSNRAKFKENNREGIYSDTNKEIDRPNFRVVPEKELTEIKKRIREHAKAEQKKERIFYGIFFICGLITLVGLLRWLN